MSKEMYTVYQIIKKVKEQLGRKMNQDIIGNRKLFWKGGNRRLKQGQTGKLALGKDMYVHDT